MKAPIFKGVKLVGIRYRPQYAQLIAAGVTKGDSCNLVREPFNPYDKAAVMVVVEETMIAYVERDVAAELATWMDQGWQYQAEVKKNCMTFMIANLTPNSQEKNEQDQKKSECA